MDTPRIILWDIETVMNVVATFRLMNQDPIPHRNVLNERYVVSAAWKELGTKKIHSVSVLDFPYRFKKDVHDDLGVLTKLHEVMSQADVLVGHNGDQYDIKFTETRMLVRGLPTLPPIPTIDTLKVAKNRFLFNSNRLDYLGQVLGCGHKVENETDLWLKVLQGDAGAIKRMVHYNKGDIDLLECAFNHLQPYIPNYINRQLFTGEGGIKCPQCGSHHYKLEGWRFTTTRRYRRYHCLDCGRWFKDRHADKLVIPPVVAL
jgi:DNA-directed RNA polymerase subunit RPC12/RpoP